MENIENKLVDLFEAHFGEKVSAIAPMRAHGSNRQLYRLQNESRSVIGVSNDDRSENVAFLEFSRHFRQAGLPVPEIYVEKLKTGLYLEEDLGDTTLFDALVKVRSDADPFPAEIAAIYRKVVRILPEFQIEAGKSVNFALCYPRHSFDRQSIMWDLNYFKYYFLKLAQIAFNEQKLEDDFDAFCQFLLRAERDYFLYRDFQSRNIMIREERPHFIDYQGGRRGALQYDIASLLYDAKANIPFDMRDELLQNYLDALSKYVSVDHKTFLEYYYGYVLIRIMQAMGAYGFRGFYERKTHFLQSVPYAIRNLEFVLRTQKLPDKLPTLTDVLQRLVQSTRLRELGDVQLPLTVRIQSFAYKHGLPEDDTGHGGGFVFDCRALPNPGRLQQYAKQTGFDADVISFLENEEEVHGFMTRVKDLIAQVVENYQGRNFSDLSVAFGCTGGQHRSVYCANMLAKYLKQKYQVNVEVLHRDMPDFGE